LAVYVSLDATINQNHQSSRTNIKKSSWLSAFVACLGLTSSLHAELILWVSDNGLKGTEVGGNGVTRGAFSPAVSTTGTPFVDQGFVDLLTAAGHTVTRYNPNATSMSTNDVPLINGYDVIILGAALNSGPFNLNSRGAKWNPHGYRQSRCRADFDCE